MSKSYLENKPNNKLKLLRKEYRLTMEDMAIKLGISKPYYFQLENKQRRLFYETAIKIAAIFNCKPDEIFFDEYKPMN